MTGSREAVEGYLARSGISVEVKVFAGSTKSSALAAKEIGCGVEQIAKSVVFAGRKTVVVILSGDKRVDSARLQKSVGASVRIATPDEVSGSTGYPIGGVPPFPHRAGVEVLLDDSLMRFQDVWAAAGTPNAVFHIRTNDLKRLVGREPAHVSAGS